MNANFAHRTIKYHSRIIYATLATATAVAIIGSGGCCSEQVDAASQTGDKKIIPATGKIDIVTDFTNPNPSAKQRALPGKPLAPLNATALFIGHDGDLYSAESTGEDPDSSGDSLDDGQIEDIGRLDKDTIYIQTLAGRLFTVQLTPDGELKNFIKRTNFPVSKIHGAPKDSMRMLRDAAAERTWTKGQIPQWSGTGKILALNDHDLIQSLDGGTNWHLFPHTKGPGYGPYELGKRNLYLSILWINEDNSPNEHILIGTSYNGLYYSANGGKGWRKVNRGVPHIRHNERVNFYESAGALGFDGQRGRVYAGFDFGRGLITAPLTGAGALEWQPVEMPDWFRARKCSIKSIGIDGDRLYAGGDCPPVVINLANQSVAGWVQPAEVEAKNIASVFERYAHDGAGRKTKWAGMVALAAGGGLVAWQQVDYNQDKKTPKFPGTGEDCRAFYISTTSSRKKLNKVKQLLDTGKFNCVVVDVKDDWGRVPREIKTPMSDTLGTAQNHWTMKPLLKLLEPYKVYKVARLVTFKDQWMANRLNGKYALQDKVTGVAWQGDHGDKWVDAYNKDAWRYNTDIAKAIVELGFDEIQFDYIRFPSDGRLSRILIQPENRATYKSEALASFLSFARQEVKAPFSIDIYGYYGLYRIGNPIGHHMQMLGEYVDYVSPMLYSSHFGDLYLSQGPRTERAYNLIYHSTWRANGLARGRFGIRNWLQAFKMKVGRWGYGRYYFDGQMQGTLDGGSHGWLWWGPISEFYGI